MRWQRAIADLRFIPARAGNTSGGRRAIRAPSVHPRAGGEHRPSHCLHQRNSGSSPRGRGTPASSRPGHPRRRFIPARAGNTRLRISNPWASTVHPRAGGEHIVSCSARVMTSGSSPRGRGTRCPRTSPPMRPTVHPRAGGEHTDAAVGSAEVTGSSPRGRGTHAVHRAPRGALRFIPARAGNTDRRDPPARRPAVHPRAGGEHAQGTRARSTGPRFIPARAGNTSAPPTAPTRPPVHPRAGGEHSAAPPSSATARGSSPRGRGTPVRRLLAADGRVHPRAGGEHYRDHTPHWRASGSSPRGRGTHPHARRPCRPRRFIPARAGNTSPTATPPAA